MATLQNCWSLFEAQLNWQASWWHMAGREHTKLSSSLQLSVAAFSLEKKIYKAVENLRLYFLVT
jgi:hypothetical protein